jgi:glucan-binding YG repeat protein
VKQNRIIKLVVATLLMSVIFSMGAFAAEDSAKIKDVSISMQKGQEEDGVITYAEPKVSSNKYYIEDFTVSTAYENWKVGSKVTYTVIVVPYEGYHFSKSDTTVKASGTSTTLISKSIEGKKITAKISYYPSIKLDTPDNVHVSDNYTVTWNKVYGCSKYEVKILKDDKDHKTISTKETEADVAEYCTESEYIYTFKVRAVANTNQSSYVKQSDWVDAEGNLSSSENNTVDGAFNISGNSITFKDSNTEKSATGWQYINNNWFYFDPDNNNHAVQNNWKKIDGIWYFFDPNGMMLTGWQKIDGYWYWLNPSEGNEVPVGGMLMGWQKAGPGNQWYYLNDTESTGYPIGAMLSNTTTPDGYSVDSSGVWRG